MYVCMYVCKNRYYTHCVEMCRVTVNIQRVAGMFSLTVVHRHCWKQFIINVARRLLQPNETISGPDGRQRVRDRD